MLGVSIGNTAILFKVSVKLLVFKGRVFGLQSKVERLIGSLQAEISFTRDQLGWELPFTVERAFKIW